MAEAKNNEQREREWEEQKRRLEAKICGLEQRNKELEQHSKELEQRTKALERKLAHLQRTSANSSKRPSSDIVKPPRAKSASKRKIGGQPGHPMQHRDPFSEQDIDRWISYSLTACPDCGAALEQTAYAPVVQQQVEIVAKPVEISQHTARWYWCPHCKKLHCSLPPEVDKAGLCGPVLTAWIGYLKGACHASFTTIRKFVRNTLGLRISRSMLAKVIAKVSAALAEPWMELRLLLPLAKILNVDETGHRENGQRLWTWCYRARTYILFKIAESRATAELLEMLGADFDGVIGCDYFSSYRCYMGEFGGVLQFCLAHFIRDVKFLLEVPDAATRRYGARLLASLREMFRLIHQRAQMQADFFRVALQAQQAEILRVAATEVPAQQDAQNLATRLRLHGESYFRFITTPGLEPTNNLAEQAIRFVVIDRHVTQGTRSEKGRQWCERIWTILATCEQQGTSAFHFIRDAVQAYFATAPAPRLLSASP